VIEKGHFGTMRLVMFDHSPILETVMYTR